MVYLYDEFVQHYFCRYYLERQKSGDNVKDQIKLSSFASKLKCKIQRMVTHRLLQFIEVDIVFLRHLS